MLAPRFVFSMKTLTLPEFLILLTLNWVQLLHQDLPAVFLSQITMLSFWKSRCFELIRVAIQDARNQAKKYGFLKKLSKSIAISRYKITVRGAGAWYLIVRGNGDGFYGNYDPNPSQIVKLYDSQVLEKLKREMAALK
jgi:hypothetical protein